jgi:hypothetical protein
MLTCLEAAPRSLAKVQRRKIEMVGHRAPRDVHDFGGGGEAQSLEADQLECLSTPLRQGPKGLL